jgi:hypothetical protein
LVRLWEEREGERGGSEMVGEVGEVVVVEGDWVVEVGKLGEVGVVCVVGEVGVVGVGGDISGEETDDEDRGRGRLVEEWFNILDDPGLCFNKFLASSS